MTAGLELHKIKYVIPYLMTLLAAYQTDSRTATFVYKILFKC